MYMLYACGKKLHTIIECSLEYKEINVSALNVEKSGNDDAPIDSNVLNKANNIQKLNKRFASGSCCSVNRAPSDICFDD